MPNFRYIKRLGGGSFGEVWRVEDLGIGAERAIKFVSRSAIPNLEAYNEEAHVLNELRHPNIISVYGTEVFSEDDRGPGAGMYGIVMEYMRDGSLEDALAAGPISLATSLRHVREACRGAERAHISGYVHRDIKPANILLNGQHTKLSDFGLCAATVGGAASGAGTLVYVAPEVLSTGVTTVKSDVYSLGVTLYELINGTEFVKWPGEDDQLEEAIRSGKFPRRSEYLPFVPSSLRRATTKALNLDPDKRYRSVDDLRVTLQNVTVMCDWQRVYVGDPEVWVGLSDHGVFEAKLSIKGASFQLRRCKKLPGTLRKVSSDCRYGLDEKTLRNQQQAVMQRIMEQGR